jgi:CubicO group peptidase (beta-lactamase class C family)
MSSEVSLVSVEDELDATFAAYVAANHSPGLAYGIVSADGLVRSGGFGVANPAGVGPGADTPFPIASMSKSFCAAATLIARDRGLLSLDDPITKYFPEFKATGAPDGDVPPPSLRMLLSMSGGLTEDNAWVDPQIGTSESELLAIVSRGLKYSHTPGTVYEYSNTGFTLVGMALQQATGRQYAEFVTTELLEPLGMTATKLSPSQFDDTVRAAGYSLDPGGTWVPYPVAESGAFLAAGGIVSTVRDLSVWVTWLGEAFRPGRASAAASGVDVLSRASRREMQLMESVIPPSVALRPAGSWRLVAGGYGLGLAIDQELHYGTVVSHGGGLPGYKLFMCWHPDSGDGLVVLTNSHRGDPSTLTREGVLRLLNAHRRPAGTVLLWPETVRARLDAESLIRSWDDELAARLFAANVDFDRPLPQRRAEIERLVAEIGPLRAARPVTEVVSAATSADVTWSIPGENGELICMVHMTPAEPPQVQEFVVRAVGLSTPRSAAPTDIAPRRDSLGQAYLASEPNVTVIVPPVELITGADG